MLKRKERTPFESPDRLNRFVEGTTVKGDIVTSSNLRIDGEIEGNVRAAGKVVIGENGVIHGDLDCQEADIEGKLNGKLTVEGLLILRESAVITGDIHTSRLHIEEGAVYNGVCRMTAGNRSMTINPSAQKDETEDIVY